jgi:hypothetical protein
MGSSVLNCADSDSDKILSRRTASGTSLALSSKGTASMPAGSRVQLEEEGMYSLSIRLLCVYHHDIHWQVPHSKRIYQV